MICRYVSLTATLHIQHTMTLSNDVRPLFELTFLALNGQDIATASKFRIIAILVVNRIEFERMQNGQPPTACYS